MRIADKMQFNQVQQNISKNRAEMSDLQNQAASQKRVNKPSDDPLAALRVLGARTEERGQTQFLKNINNAKAFMEFTDQSLAELTELLTRAKELAVGQSSDAGASEQTRLVTAQEIDQLYSQSVQIGNRKLGDRYIFAGFKTQTRPFNGDGEYSGDDGEMKLQTHKDSFITMNIPGSQVFAGKSTRGDGTVRTSSDVPRSVEELNEKRMQDEMLRQQKLESEENYVELRAPAGYGKTGYAPRDPITNEPGISIFQALRGLSVALRTNDKPAIQESLDSLDAAVSQVVLARAEVGSRVTVLGHTVDSLNKAVLDNKAMASQLEDADAFQVVSDINRADSALRASLETSPKLIEKNLLDFLR